MGTFLFIYLFIIATVKQGKINYLIHLHFLDAVFLDLCNSPELTCNFVIIQ